MKKYIIDAWNKQCCLIVNIEGKVLVSWLTDKDEPNQKNMIINADNYSSMIDFLIAIEDISSGYLQAIDMFGTIEEKESDYYKNILAIYNEVNKEVCKYEQE